MPTRDERPTIPNFGTEEEEANWWDARKDRVADEMIQAIDDGTARRGGPSHALRDRRPRQDIRELAAHQGQDEAAYAGALLHNALEREVKESRP